MEGMGQVESSGGMQHGLRVDTQGSNEDAAPNGAGATAGAKTGVLGRGDGRSDRKTLH